MPHPVVHAEIRSQTLLFFVGVDDVEAALARAEQLGGRVVQPVQNVPGVSFGVLADPQGHLIGVANSER